MHFFFYGTLLDADVRALVMPHLAGKLRLQPGRLKGHRRQRGRQGSYPVLVGDPKSQVEGLVAQGLDARSLYRMAHFEGHHYLPKQLKVSLTDGTTRSAWTFMPIHPGLAGSESWSLRLWQLRHKPRLLREAQCWMREFGVDSGQSHDAGWLLRRRIHALAAELEEAESQGQLSWAA